MKSWVWKKEHAQKKNAALSRESFRTRGRSPGKRSARLGGLKYCSPVHETRLTLLHLPPTLGTPHAERRETEDGHGRGGRRDHGGRGRDVHVAGDDRVHRIGRAGERGLAGAARQGSAGGLRQATQQSWGSWGRQQQQLQQMQMQQQMPQQPGPPQQMRAPPAANAAARGSVARKKGRATLRGGPCVSVSDVKVNVKTFLDFEAEVQTPLDIRAQQPTTSKRHRHRPRPPHTYGPAPAQLPP